MSTDSSPEKSIKPTFMVSLLTGSISRAGAGAGDGAGEGTTVSVFSTGGSSLVAV